MPLPMWVVGVTKFQAGCCRICRILQCVGAILCTRRKELDFGGTNCCDDVEEAQGRNSIHCIAQHSQCGWPMDPTKYDIESRVTPNPGKSGVWARDAKLHGGQTLRGAYKRQMIDWRFKVANVGCDVSNNPQAESRAESILIRWAYSPWQMRFYPDVVAQRPKCNCKCFSFDTVTLLSLYVCQLSSLDCRL